MRVPPSVWAGLVITGGLAAIGFLGLFTPVTEEEAAIDPATTALWFQLAMFFDFALMALLFTLLLLIRHYIRNLPEGVIQPSSGMRFCMKCGFQVQADARFCHRCGKDLVVIHEPTV